MIDVVGTLALDTVVLVPRLPSPNEVARVSELEIRPGGAAGNVAMALARLGANVRLVAAVGRDFAGSDYERALLDAHVNLSHLVRTEGATPHAILASDADGSQHIYFFPGEGHALARARPSPAKLAHFSAGEISAYPALMEAADVVTFDPGQETFHRDLAEIRRCAPLVDVWLLNTHELARLTSGAGLDVAAMLHAGARAVVETRGKDGARVHEPSGTTDIPALPAKVVDPTGGGDAHRAGFLFAFERGASVAASARFASAVAAFAVEGMGAQANLPTFEAARARYRSFFREEPFPPRV